MPSCALLVYCPIFLFIFPIRKCTKSHMQYKKIRFSRVLAHKPRAFFRVLGLCSAKPSLEKKPASKFKGLGLWPSISRVLQKSSRLIGITWYLSETAPGLQHTLGKRHLPRVYNGGGCRRCHGTAYNRVGKTGTRLTESKRGFSGV